MSDADQNPKKHLRLLKRDGISFGFGLVAGAALLYAGYRFDPVPAVVRLTKNELQSLIDNPHTHLRSAGYKGTIVIAHKTA